MSSNSETQTKLEIDPHSGMLVNLAKVDQALSSLRSYWQATPAVSLKELLEDSVRLMTENFKGEGVSVQRLCLHEKRGWFFGWEKSYFHGFTQFAEFDGGLHEVCATFEGEAPESIEDVRSLCVPSAGLGDAGDSVQVIAKLFWQSNPSLTMLTVERCGSRQKVLLQL